MNANEKNPQKQYFCKKCDFTSRHNNDWMRHLSTTKHKRLTMLKMLKKKPVTYICKTCSKEYKHQSSLCRHKKTCKKRHIPVVKAEDESLSDPPSTLVVALLQELIQVQKENQEKQKEGLTSQDLEWQ